MKRIFTILLFTLWTSVAFTQTTKDSLAELQSLLDSIPDISLAELGIDTTAEIVPDTLHLAIPTSIASDTTYARNCLNQAIDLIKTGKYDDAYAKADTAKHIYQMNIGYVTKEVADCLHQMGRVKGRSNKILNAILNYTNSAKIRIKLFGELNNDFAISLHNIGVNYLDLDNYNKALEFNQKLLKIRIRLLGKEHLDVGQTYHNIGMCYASKEKYDNAINYYKKALEIRIKKLGDKHLNVGYSYMNLGNTLGSKEEYGKAMEFKLKGF
jgi:tetratricopeptide (TPR) repeat protein